MSTPPPSGAGDGGDDQGDGTQASGYVTPDLGPFECDNCTHFQAPSSCDNPQVMSDPEVNGQVEAKGCCNLFKSLHGDANEQTQSPMSDSGAGAAAADVTGAGENSGGYGG